MRLCRAVPLLLLLALAKATTPGPDGSTVGLAESIPPSPPELWTVSYGDAVSAAVELLNMRAVSPYVLRLREAQPRPGWVSAELLHPGGCTGPGRCRIRPFSGLNLARFGAGRWGQRCCGSLMGPVPSPSPGTCGTGRS